MDDLAALEAAIYDQSFRALDEQARVLDALRARAGALAAAASVATALLGGLGGATRSAHARLDTPTWSAIALFVAVFLLSLLVTTPRVNTVFSHDPHRLMSEYLAPGPPLPLGAYRRTITYYNGRHFAANARTLRSLDRMLTLASVCLAVELVLWLWVFAS